MNESIRRLLLPALAAVAILCLLPLTFGPGGSANGVDRWCADRVESLLGGHDTVLSLLADPSTPLVVIPVLLITAVFAWRRRSRIDAAAVLLIPLVAVVLNTAILKPLFDRHLNDYLAYPSGHTVSLVSATTVVALVVRRAWVVIVGVVALLSVTVGMIGLGYHHVTDIVGGTCVGFAVPVVLVSILVSASEKACSDTIA